MNMRTVTDTPRPASGPSALALLCISLVTQAALAQSVRFRDEVFTAQLSATDVAYGSAWNRWTNANETLLLDVYEPAGDAATAGS